MSSTISSYTTNWIKVKYVYEIEEHIQHMNETAECFESGDLFTIHHHKGQIRITGFDLIDQSLGYYEDEEEEVWIDLEEALVNVLAKGEVLRLTSLSWFKGRLESADISVTTWDGRHEHRSMNTWMTEISQSLDIDAKQLKGWN